MRQNMVMDCEEEMQQELSLFKSAGGGTICELSVLGMRCNPHRPEKLAEISRQTGVNIVHATGFYCHKFLPANVHAMSVEEMRDAMLQEIRVGVEVSGVGCAVWSHIPRLFLASAWHRAESTESCSSSSKRNRYVCIHVYRV